MLSFSANLILMHLLAHFLFLSKIVVHKIILSNFFHLKIQYLTNYWIIFDKRGVKSLLIILKSTE